MKCMAQVCEVWQVWPGLGGLLSVFLPLTVQLGHQLAGLRSIPRLQPDSIFCTLTLLTLIIFTSLSTYNSTELTRANTAIPYLNHLNTNPGLNHIVALLALITH